MSPQYLIAASTFSISLQRDPVVLPIVVHPGLTGSLSDGQTVSSQELDQVLSTDSRNERMWCVQYIKLRKPPSKFLPASRHAILLRVKACVSVFKSAHNSNGARLCKDALPTAPSDSVDKQMSYLDTRIPRQRKNRQPSIVTAQLTRSMATKGRLCLFDNYSTDKAIYKSALFSAGT